MCTLYVVPPSCDYSLLLTTSAHHIGIVLEHCLAHLTRTDNASIGSWRWGLVRSRGTKRLGSIADPPGRSFPLLYSIHLSTDSITTRCIFFCLNSSFSIRDFHSHLPLVAIPDIMSVYLHPLSIPSRNSSMSDASPYTQSTSPTAVWSSPTTTPSRRGSESTHFLNIPGPSTPHIKDADSVDKEANAAAAAAGAATASSSPSSESEWRRVETIPTWRRAYVRTVERTN